jgi:hypothetical protein
MEENIKPHVWARFRRFIGSHKLIFFSLLGIVLLGASAAITFGLFYTQPVAVAPAKVIEIKSAEVVVPKPEIKYYSPLTGNLVVDEASTKQPVTAIMIENSPDARPQSGLKDSGVVFEAIAEGGITRFLVMYQQEKPQLIGPVRSIRLYDVDWVAAFNASIGHVGGSARGLAEVHSGSYRDIDQFFNSATYWRATDRYAPHNVYTSFAKLDALNAKKGYTSSNFTGFPRVDGQPSTTPDATQIAITISSSLYNSTYTYDKTTNTYLRSQAGAPHLDRESGQITPSVIIAMRVDESTVFEDGNRESITTIGSGPATIFQNGTATAVTWRKTSKLSQITFTDGLGVDVPLVRGQTWIAAIKNNGGNVSWQ